MKTIHSAHYTEWQRSGVDDSLINASIQSLNGQAVYESLCYAPDLPRIQAGGRLDLAILHRYQPASQGGWWCTSLDPNNHWQPMRWGCFKPDQPRRGFNEKNAQYKPVKYEHPPKVPTRAFFLPATREQQQKVSRRCGVPVTDTAFWPWVLMHPSIPIIITEGAKKAACLLSQGYAAIALPGIWNGQRTEKHPVSGKVLSRILIPELKKFAVPERPIYFCFDQDTKPATRHAVQQALKVTGELFQERGCAVHVITWTGTATTKGVDDFIIAQGADAFHSRFAAATPLAVFTAGLLWELSYTPDYCVNERYLRPIPYPKTGLACIKSPKGTGKTQALKALLNNHAMPALKQEYADHRQQLAEEQTKALAQIEADHQTALKAYLFISEADIQKHRQQRDTKRLQCEQHYARQLETLREQYQAKAKTLHDRKILIITHRIQLGRAICHSLGVDWVDTLSTTLTKGRLGYGICIDSLHQGSHIQFDPGAWEGAVVILDEVEQVLSHVLHAETCYKNRVSILQTLEALLATVIGTGGLIIAQDADLSDVSVNYLKALAERASGYRVRPWIALNTYQPTADTRWNVTLYEENKPTTILEKIRHYLARQSPLLIHTDSQRAKSPCSTTNLETWCQRQAAELGLSPLKILRIDAETVSDPNSPAQGFAEKINSIASNYDIIIASPSIGTGVSIDVQGHFKAVFGVFQGVAPDTETRQALSRLRAPVPRYIWAASYGVGGIGNRAADPYSLIRSKQKTVKLTIKLLKDLDFNLDEAYDPVSLRTWAQMAARTNASLSHYRHSLHIGLLAEGHQVQIYQPTTLDKTSYEQLKHCSQQNWQQELHAIVEAEDLSESAFLLLKDQRQKTKAEQQQVRKYLLQQKYGVNITPYLVEQDAKGWYTKLRLHYYLTQPEPFVRRHDQQHLTNHLERGNNQIFLPDARLWLPKVAILKAFDPLQWFDQELSCHTPGLYEWAEHVKRYRRDLYDLGFGSIHENATPLEVLRKLAEALGAKSEFLRQCRINGERVRFYLYRIPADHRQEIFKVWQQRDQEALETQPPSPSQGEYK